MKKWQYKLVTGNAEDVESAVNQLADQEWEPIWLTPVPEGLACMLKKKKDAYAASQGHRGPWHRAA